MTLDSGPTQRPLVRKASDEVPARRIPRLLLAAWGALLLNVLTPLGTSPIIPVPYVVLQVVAQSALALALVLALLANPKMVVRPNPFLILLSLMAVVALAASVHNEFLWGSTYRAIRLLGFVVCLWLLTPWWGRRDMLLLRVHLLCLGAVVASVIVGALLAPGSAYNGRLEGVLWPTPPGQIAHYAAIVLGTMIILWMCRVITGRSALLGVTATVPILIGAQSRTAATAAIVGLILASASLFLGNVRVRRTSLNALLAAAAGAMLFAPQIIAWAARGQSAEEARDLTGRTAVWAAATSGRRPLINELFGSGLSNKSFDGTPIDGNWIASYIDLGWFGIVVQGSLLLLLAIMAVTHARGPRRALAIYLICYCVMASITEVGLGDASPYLLDLAVAASLLTRSPAVGRTAAGATAIRTMRVQGSDPGAETSHP
jgi:hypothetical protein